MGFLNKLFRYKKDDATAFEKFTQRAEAGDADAQTNLGWMYATGVKSNSDFKGVPQDDQEAMRWFTKAAEAGHAKAQGYLGEMYRVGKGTPQDFRKAAHWFTKAAEAGDADAQFNLGVMYREGEGVPQDHVHAHKWFGIVATTKIYTELGGLGVQNRHAIESHMSEQQIAEAKQLAREWKPVK